MTEGQRFVILSLPRTGSTYLVDYLDAVPGIRCLSEVFNRNTVLLRHHQPKDPTLADKAARDADPIGFLARLEPDVGACDWFGVKFFPGHGDRLLRYFCTSRQWKKIFLWRDNLLEQYISFLLASEKFGQESWERVADEATLTVPASALIDDLHGIERSYIEIEEALAFAEREQVFTLEYDDLGNALVMEQLLRFLGLPDVAIPALMQQGNSMPAFERGPRAAARIVNGDEVRRALRNTRYSRWLMD
ncbi:MAG TPA: hypothetical protein VGL83_07910 [Stellaceae bacterium]|jgi:LPS sulfotransferase NodH